jgi:hypothetical protein
MENEIKEKEQPNWMFILVIGAAIFFVILIVSASILTGSAGNHIVCNKLAAQINSGNTTAIAIWTANECPCYNNNLIPQTLKSVDFSNTTMCQSLNSFSAR